MTLEEFMSEREDWMRIITFENEHGGFGIALVIDGYYSKEGGEEMADYWRRELPAMMVREEADGR